jgi:type IV pilus assembly protein PilW
MKSPPLQHCGVSAATPRLRATSGQRGFTLVEIMIAILIGVFLLGGLLTLVQTMKVTSLAQNGLSQLQDNERLAMRIMTDVIQATGDYPNPVANTPNLAFPALPLAPFPSGFAKSQSMVGRGAGAAVPPGDEIAVRYATSGTDGLTNCVGGQSLTAVTFVNVFSIDANGNLQCQLTTINAGGGQTTVTATLVSGVTNLQILYGVKTNTAVTTTAVDAYLDANQVIGLPNPPGYAFPWIYIKSVQLTLTFLNPLAAQPGQPATISLMRVVNVMNQVGETL